MLSISDNLNKSKYGLTEPSGELAKHKIHYRFLEQVKKKKATINKKTQEYFQSKVITNKLKSLFKILSEILLVAVSGREPLVVEQAFLVMVEGQVGGHIDYIAYVHSLHFLQVLSIVLVSEEEEGQDGGELSVLDVWRGGDGLR